MSTVTDFSAGFITGLTAGLARLFGAIPNIIGAIIILAIGWVIAGIIGTIVVKLCRAIHVETVSARVGVSGFLQQSGSKLTASDILGEIVKWVIRLVFIEMAAEQLGMPAVTSIINSILGFVPNIIVAIIILGIGAFLGKVLAGLVHGATSEAQIGNPGLLASLTNGAVLAFAIIAALNELNVAPVVVDTLYIGLVSAVSLALGLAFGLGGRESAAKLTERWSAQLAASTNKVQSLPPKTTMPSGASATTPIIRTTP